jgi:hypothetical protein
MISREEFNQFARQQELWHKQHSNHLDKMETRFIDDIRLVHSKIENIEIRTVEKVSVIQKEGAENSGKLYVIIGLFSGISAAIVKAIEAFVQSVPK